MTLLRPNTELVALAWLGTLAGVTGRVATTLPRDPATWSANGFVTVGPVVGGSSADVARWRMPRVQVECWANPGAASNRPPWNRAAQLAEVVMTAIETQARCLTLDVGAGYAQARVTGAHSPTEPRRMPSDVASYARYLFDFRLDWAALP